jgi:hypothetical protein
MRSHGGEARLRSGRTRMFAGPGLNSVRDGTRTACHLKATFSAVHAQPARLAHPYCPQSRPARIFEAGSSTHQCPLFEPKRALSLLHRPNGCARCAGCALRVGIDRRDRSYRPISQHGRRTPPAQQLRTAPTACSPHVRQWVPGTFVVANVWYGGSMAKLRLRGKWRVDPESA